MSLDLTQPYPGKQLGLIMVVKDLSGNTTFHFPGAIAGGDDLILQINGETLQALPVTGGSTTGIDVLSCNTIYIGGHARFVQLTNGLKLEIMDNTGTWIQQGNWTEGTGAAPGQPPTGWWSDTVTVNQTLYLNGRAR